MRALSPTMIKKNQTPKNALPQPGSRVRFIYDTLYEARGDGLSRDDYRALVELCGGLSKYNAARVCLIDLWGCDIRGRALVGEWCGRVYVDYTEAARLAA